MGGSRGPGRSPTRSPRRTAGRSTARGGSARAAAAAAKGAGSRFTGRAIVLLAVLVLLLASYTSTLHAWWQARGDIAETRAEIAMREAAIEDLQDEKTRWNDPAFVKQQARERFGWVMPGEVGYRVIGADGTVTGDAPTLDDPPDPQDRRWYDTLWGSVQAADRAEAATPDDPDPDEVLESEQE